MEILKYFTCYFTDITNISFLKSVFYIFFGLTLTSSVFSLLKYFINKFNNKNTSITKQEYIMASEAFVSLTTNNEYAKGAMVLGKSLRNTNTSRKLVLMVTKGVSESMRTELLQVWDDLFDVTLLDSHDKEKLTLMSRPELGCTFSKLRAWTLTQFTKCVFLDADTLVIQNVDDLFERDEFSAAPDIGWPDCFNTGVFVFKPSLETYDNLLLHAKANGSFDGGDQGLLNDYFSSWATRDISHHLPFIYNMVSNISYTYLPAFKRFGQDVKIVHFLGSIKPWHHSVHASNGAVQLTSNCQSSQADYNFNQMWWDLNVSQVTCGAAASEASASSMPSSWQQWHDNRTATEKLRDQRSSWEHGHPDYTGSDKFENIIDHIQNVIIDEDKSEKSTPIKNN